jgi:prevent-host-death family protein
MHSAPLTEAREKLSELVDDVAVSSNAYTITRHGRPAAVLLGADEYESLIETLNILSDDDTLAAIAEARRETADVDAENS